MGAHTVRSHGAKIAREHLHDWLILLLLILIDVFLNVIEPFHRFIGEEMMVDLKYPFHKDTIPMWAVPILCGIVPFAIFCVYYYNRRDIYDLHHAVLGLLFSVLITGVLTDSIKDAVGRPRPNFFYRCFPDGKPAFDPVTHDVMCHGLQKVIKEGYKSFPSGHTSWSFAGLTYLAWYVTGKVRAFDRRGHVAKLCIMFLPILAATLVGISRVDDYWHHWTDVFAGALIGSIVAALCYLQFFPYPYDDNGSFAGLTYLAWYVPGKVRAFDRRGHVAKLCIMFLPILAATLVGISRVDDYWHHWTDVFAGALIGSIVAALCYLQFFPYPYDDNGWALHKYFEMAAERNGRDSTMQRRNTVYLNQTDIEAASSTEP